MYTNTHILTTLVVLHAVKKRNHNIEAGLGAALPDLAMLTAVGTGLLFYGSDLGSSWITFAKNETLQLVQNFTNSLPLYLTALIISFAARCALCSIFLLSAIAHITIDFVLHHSDAHKHFWPLSDWVFRSPISYWEPEYWGILMYGFEVVLIILCAFFLLRKFNDVSRTFSFFILFLVSWSLFGAIRVFDAI